MLHSRLYRLFPGVRELMLPDGSSLLDGNEDDALLGYNIDTAVVISELQQNINLLESQHSSTSSTDIQPIDREIIHQVEDDAYIAMKLLGNDLKLEEMTVLLDLIKRMETLQRDKVDASFNKPNSGVGLVSTVSTASEPMTIPVAVYNEYLRVAYELKQYDLIEEMFVKDISVVMESDDFQSPHMVFKQQADMTTWSWYLQAMAKNGNPDNAMKEIDRLEKIPSLQVTTEMYNAVLDVYIDSKRFEDAYALWERMHVTPDLQLNNESFISILKYCSMTNQSERAFYVYDEMKALDLNPNAAVFAGLFKACGEAPQYVNGYEDTVEEAMCLMEGCEIFPTSEVYENILHAYSVPGDIISAEFYFWEMKRKGLEMTPTAYTNLLLAHSHNSSVGLKKWGYNQRFVKKQEQLTEDQKVVRKIPPAKMAKLSKLVN